MVTFRLVLELLYFVSGIIIAVAAIIGLAQLRISRETSRTNAKRDSFRLAADQCAYYFNHIIPLANEFEDLVRKKQLHFFKKTKVLVKDNKVKVMSSADPEDIKAINDLELLLLTNKLYNAWEGFAVFFANGVADESVAFSTIGLTFHNSVKTHMPILILCHDGGYYPNLMKLFFLWNNRLEIKEIQTKKENIENKFKQMKDSYIKPIGTE